MTGAGMMKIKKAREMKKYFGIFAAAFAALSVLSCQREVEPEGGNDANLVSLKILTSVDAKSSLELDGESAPTGRVLWDYGDEITVFDGVAPRHFTASDIPAEGSHVATFDGNVDAGATAFAAVYPYAEGYTAADYAAGVISTAIPSEQLVAAPGSYSRNANVCVAYALKSDAEQVPLSDDEYIFTQMLFHNVGGLLKFTLSQDGVHQSVTIRTADNSALTGAIEATAATGEAVSAAVGAVDYVTIAAENGGFLAAGDYYAVVLPFTDKTVSLEFSNGEKSKKRNSKAVISLDRAAIRDLGTIDAGIDYIPGDYLIGSYQSNKWILMDPACTGKIYNSFNTTVATPYATLSYTEFFTELDTNDYLWHVRKDSYGYYIYHTDGDANKYLSYSGGSNEAYQADELASPATYFDVTIENGVATIESKATSGRKLRYNSGNPRYAFYATGQQDIWFIPAAYDSRELLNLEFAESAKSLNTKNYSSFTGQAATATSGSAPVSVSLTYSWDGDAIIESFNTATGVLALNGATGTATVSASYTGEDYRPAEASYTITVSSATAAKWVKTDLADIAAGDTLVIVDLNTVMAMTNANGTSSAPAATSIILAAANTELNTAPAADVRWVLEKPTASTYKLKKPGTTDYLYCTNSNNGVRVGTNSNNVFSIALDGSNNPFLLNSGTSRYVGKYKDGNDWRCYTTIHANISDTRTAFFAKQDNTTWVLDAINVTTPPTKTVYEVGDSFDASGMVVSATYVDEDDNTHTKVVVVDASELTIVAPDMTTGGAKSVSISWEEKNTTQAITVIEWGVDELEITTPPDKVNYSVGDTFDPDGMVVVAHYVDLGGSSETKDVIVDKESLEFTPSGALVSGTTYVRISFGGKSVNQPISVADWVLDSITITTAPTKTTYSVGETFNPSGMVVTAHYVDNGGSADPVDEFVNLESLTIPTNALTLGTTSVTIGYTFKDRTRTASQAITVIDSAPSHSVTFNQLASSTGCTYTVSAGGSSVTSGGDVTEGAEVTLAVANLGTGYTFSSWLVTKADDVNTTVTVTNGKFTMPAYDVKIFASFTVTDNLTRSLIGVTGTGYTDWTNKSDKSPAVYAGKTAGGNSSIQFNTYSTSNKRGIISSTSGGYVKSVALTWNSNTSNGRSVTVRGSTSEMTMSNFTSAASALSISKDDSAEKDISAAKYTYVGFQAIGGALYLNNIAITWVVTSD